MQVIEKVKVVPEGYNGAGMNYDGGGMLGDGSTNINVLGATAGSGSGAPTAFHPFFIYLNFSMDKFIDVIVDGILSNFDFGFMFIVNVLTYIIIKVIDYFNGDNKVPTWQKRCVLVISIATMAGIYIAAGYDNAIMLVNSAILAPVFWSWVISPILKKLGVGYKDIDNTIG